MKNLMLFVLLVGIVSAGIGYSLYQSPDLPLQGVFKSALKTFAENAKSLEEDYKADRVFEVNSQALTFDFTSFDGTISQIKMVIDVSASLVTLRFSEGDFPLAGQSVQLEPHFEAEQFRWKCINGSVLVRVRTKACRLGNGETRESMQAM